MRINLFLNETEVNNLKALLNRYGGKAPAFIHMLLKQAYEKEFGGYKSKKPGVAKPIEESLSEEQICELLGGKVIKKDGEMKCFEPKGMKGLVVPLSLMGKKGKVGDYSIKR